MDRYNLEIQFSDTLNKARVISSQLNSHFIFNCLMSIKEICYKDGQSAASLIDDFSSYLKDNIYGLSSDSIIPFENEMKHAEKYLQLSKEALNRDFVLKKYFEIVDFNVPALSIQPLVENAVKYGDINHNEIYVSTKSNGNMIKITIKNRVKQGEDIFSVNNSDHLGFSMKAIEERLNLQCKGSLIFTMDQDFAVVTVEVPKKGVL